MCRMQKFEQDSMHSCIVDLVLLMDELAYTAKAAKTKHLRLAIKRKPGYVWADF